MTRTTLSTMALAFLSGSAQASPPLQQAGLRCVGPSDDHGLVYVTHVYLDDETEHPARVLMWQLNPFAGGWELLGDYTTFDNLTPAQPTDVFYRYVFRAADAKAGDLALMLMAGGFTQRATAQVVAFGEVDPQALATMQCTD